MVWLRREDLEDWELRHLSCWATTSRDCGGRRVPEPEDPLRTAFQRDRDRIIHCRAFRRLQHKTQVLASYEGDHHRSRMTHSLEVSQMARCVARSLRLNADLAEAVALGHDLGHPPFGHTGEETLDELMRGRGGFRHNTQGLRIVDYLEDRAGDGHGLNLVLAVRRSLLKGRIPPGFPVSQDIAPGPAPLEARVVDLCDQIAYLCHDLDDGLRAGILTRDMVGGLGLWREAARAAGTEDPKGVISEMVALLIQDLVTASHESLAEAATPHLDHGAHIDELRKEVLAFLYRHFYHSERVKRTMREGSERMVVLFHRLVAHPEELPVRVRRRLDADGPHRVVCDYIAGMTDRYLLRREARSTG